MPPANKEKKGLTLEKLASYDDVITDALVDKVYYWTSIRKNRGGRFTGMRGLHEEDIAAIIRQHVAWGKDPVEAVQKLLLLPGLKKYLTSLKNDGEKEQFKRHLRRYVNIYMPDCPFEVTTTNRYTITEHEASVTARRDLNPREEIKYLTGVQVAMTEQQEKSLELARKDFSLVYSSRKKTRSLFLGPARFANHDCDPNAKLSTKGYDGMQIVAVKPIDQGEEITVSYGSDYFGENNEECLCQTCENRQQNGWAPMRPAERSDEEDEAEAKEAADAGAGASIEQEIAPTSDDASKKRQRDESTPESASESTASEPATKRVRIEQSSSSINRHVPDLLREQTLKKAHESSLRHEIPIFSIEDTSLNPNPSLSVFQEMRRAQQPGSFLTAKLDETSSSREATPQSPVASSISKASEGTDATSVDDDHQSENTLPHVKVDPDTLSDHPALGVATVKEEVTLTATDNVPWPSPPAEEVADDSNSELSSMSSSLEFDSEHEQLVKRKPQPFLRTTRSKSRFDTANRIGTPILLPTLSPSTRYVPNKRHLGDYMTAPSLLSAKYSKWVECQTCDAHFVQQDGYHTRKECPRCERHSKLYGYPWPKTEKEGKNDKEERIADHRTVHRFVDPQQEKQLKKNGGRRGMKDRVTERFSTPRSASLLDGGSGSGSGSGSARSSASAEGEGPRRRRRVRMTM